MAANHTSFLIDPEYEEIQEPLCEERIKIIEERKNETKAKIESIFKSQFQQEITKKEIEIEKLDDILHESRSKLDRLRACIITKYYASSTNSTTENQLSHEQRQKRQKGASCSDQSLNEDQNKAKVSAIHPAVKECLGKTPRIFAGPSFNVKTERTSPEKEIASCTTAPISSQNSVSSKDSVEESVVSRQAPRTRTKLKIVFGNVSKYIPTHQRMDNDQLTHIWKAYIREGKGYPKLSEYVKKVVFFLHPSFRPNDVIEISESPFELTRRGWGDFPLRIQLHFKDPRNKPVDLIHHLKLDKRYTGLTALGPEVHADLQLYNVSNLFIPPNTSDSVVTSAKDPALRSESTQSHLRESQAAKKPCSSNVNSVNMSVSVNDSNNIESTAPSLIQNKSIFSQLTEKTCKKVAATCGSSFINQNNTCTNITEPSLRTPLEIRDEHTHQVKRRIQVPKSVIVNSTVNANSMANASTHPKNGLTAFVKCTDSQGRTLLVPQSSLICISSNNVNEPADSTQTQQNHIPFTSPSQLKTTSAGLSFVRMTQPSPKLLNSNLPLYILKPAQQNGMNQILLFSASEENSKMSEVSQAKSPMPYTTAVNGTPVDSFGKPASSESGPVTTKYNKPRMRWEQALHEISTDSCNSFVQLLKKLLRVLLRVQQSVGALSFPLSYLQDESKFCNIGKKRAAEWQFSGLVRRAAQKILQDKPNQFLNSSSVWTRKQIMYWSRKHGYFAAERTRNIPQIVLPGENIPKSTICEPDELVNHLRKESQGLERIYEEIDVCNVDERTEKRHEVQMVNIPHTSPSSVYIKECAAQIGVNIKPVELEPSITVPVVEDMLLTVCKEFVTDIIRSASAAGYTRMGGKICPAEITLIDVCQAIREEEVFQFLTNKFLGHANR